MHVGRFRWVFFLPAVWGWRGSCSYLFPCNRIRPRKFSPFAYAGQGFRRSRLTLSPYANKQQYSEICDGLHCLLPAPGAGAKPHVEDVLSEAENQQHAEKGSTSANISLIHDIHVISLSLSLSCHPQGSHSCHQPVEI